MKQQEIMVEVEPFSTNPKQWDEDIDIEFKAIDRKMTMDF